MLFKMFVFVVGICFLVFASGDSLFDLDELENSQYSVSILDTPISLDQAEGDVTTDNIVIMMNKFGQKYQCKLPQQANNEDAEGSGTAEPEPEINVAALIKPLHSSPCLVRTKDWWTYQICFGREISQYHVENDKPAGEIMSLGIFNPDSEIEDKSMTYHPELYTNGTKCELTGRGRETELRFVCNEKAPREFIGDIFEPKSCEYTIVIHTDKICSVPQFRPPADAVPMDINCSPILKADQMEKYERYAKLKARKLQLKKLKVKKEQQQFLKLLSDGANPLKAIPGFGDDNINKLIKELGSFMDNSFDQTSHKPEVKVIDLKGEMPSLKTDKTTEKLKANSKDNTNAKEEGWNLVHESNAIKALKAQVEDLENKLKAKQDYVSQNLNTRLLSVYQATERAQVDEDLAKAVLLRNEKEMLEKTIKDEQDEIEKLKLQLSKAKTLLFETELRESGFGGENKKLLDKNEAGELKKRVKDEFPQIVKDAMKDLGIKDEDLNSMDDTMAAMEDELNVLLKKLQGQEKGTASLKRDGKRSVKKELREDESQDNDDNEAVKTIQETVERLKQMESTLDNVEEGLKEKKEKLLKEINKVKSTEGDDSSSKGENLDEESKRFLGDLETKLKSKIEKLGLDKLNLESPIEVKVIATNVPAGDEDMESMDTNYYEGILHNIMIGNDKGYKDIQNQFAADKNYKFKVDDSDVQKLEQDIDNLEAKVGGEDPTFTFGFNENFNGFNKKIDQDLDLEEDSEIDIDEDMDADIDEEDMDLEDSYDIDEDDDDLEDEIDGEFDGSISSMVDELLGVPEGHRRPSAAHTKVVPDDIEDKNEDKKNKDEL